MACIFPALTHAVSQRFWRWCLKQRVNQTQPDSLRIETEIESDTQATRTNCAMELSSEIRIFKLDLKLLLVFKHR